MPMNTLDWGERTFFPLALETIIMPTDNHTETGVTVPFPVALETIIMPTDNHTETGVTVPFPDRGSANHMPKHSLGDRTFTG